MKQQMRADWSAGDAWELRADFEGLKRPPGSCEHFGADSPAVIVYSERTHVICLQCVLDEARAAGLLPNGPRQGLDPTSTAGA